MSEYTKATDEFLMAMARDAKGTIWGAGSAARAVLEEAKPSPPRESAEELLERVINAKAPVGYRDQVAHLELLRRALALIHADRERRERVVGMMRNFNSALDRWADMLEGKSWTDGARNWRTRNWL